MTVFPGLRHGSSGDAVHPPEDVVSRVGAPLLAFLVGTLGHLPALGAYWNQDDWGLLGRAAGHLADHTAWPARLVSQVLYWRLLWPLCGLATYPYTATRILLHGASAALVARIAARGGLTPPGQLVAGLLFGATAMAFTPLYWASGVQELLGAFLALAAVERWLAGGRWNRAATVILGGLSILSKENGLGLPLLLATLLWWEGHRSRRAGTSPARESRPAPSRSGPTGWLSVALLAGLAAAEAVLVLRHFSHGPGDPYAIGSWRQVLQNMASYGWWLLAPGPLYASRFNLAMGVAGWSVWVLWVIWAVWNWRRARRWPAACGLAALLSLIPALPLANHAFPYLAYLGVAAGALTVAALVPPTWSLRLGMVLMLLVTALVWAYGGMTMRLTTRNAQGIPADPLVRRTAVSYSAIRTLSLSPPDPRLGQEAVLILLQPPPPGPETALARQLGPQWVTGSLLYKALEGTLGPRLVLAGRARIEWTNDLSGAEPTAFVLADGGPALLPWGRTPQALLYLTLTEVARGQFDRAKSHLRRAAYLSSDRIPFFYDRDLMLVDPANVLDNAPAFQEYLVAGQAGGSPAPEAEALLQVWQGLLQAAANLPPSPLIPPVTGRP